MDSIIKLAKAIKTHKNTVFFGGAGVSTESGVPDFRSAEGIFKTHRNAEEMLSYGFFKAYPGKFMEFYRKALLFPDVKPNFAHEYLAHLENIGKLSAVITQNIDGLHQAAGSKNVIELHGTAHKCFCDLCKNKYPASVMNDYKEALNVPYCNCGGVIRPAIVMYGENLNSKVMDDAVKAIARADMLIIAGTSLRVYPAAGFIRYFHGECIAVINRDSVLSYADITINSNIGETFKKIKEILKEN